MAKIGNEAKLILKLAKERMEKARTVFVIDAAMHGEDTMRGYDRAYHDWQETLDQVISEIEER